MDCAQMLVNGILLVCVLITTIELKRFKPRAMTLTFTHGHIRMKLQNFAIVDNRDNATKSCGSMVSMDHVSICSPFFLSSSHYYFYSPPPPPPLCLVICFVLFLFRVLFCSVCLFFLCFFLPSSYPVRYQKVGSTLQVLVRINTFGNIQP